METAGNNKLIAKNTILLYIRTFIILCINLYTSRIVLEELGVVDFGLYGVIGGVVVMFTFLTGSLGSSSSRFITVAMGKNDKLKLQKVFSTSFTIHATMAFLILILCEVIGGWFINNQMVVPKERIDAAMMVFHISVFTAVISLTQVPYNSLIIAHERMSIYAYVGLFEAISKLCVAFLITINPIDKLVWYALLLFIVQVTVMMTYRLYCIKYFEESRLHLVKDIKLYKSMLAYSLYDFIGCTSVMAQGQGLNLVLNVFCGPVVNAARTIAYQIQGAVTQFSSNFMTAVTPQIIKLYAQGEINEMLILVRRSSIFCFVLMVMFVLPLSFEIDFVLRLWLGNFPGFTASFTILILINTTIDTFRRPRINCFHATGNIKLSNIVTGGILCMALPLGYVLMRLGYNPNTVFIGVIITSCIADCTNMIILRRYIPFSIINFMKQVHLRCFAHLICILPIPFFICRYMDDGIIRFILIILYSVLMSLLSGLYVAFNKNDRIKIISLIRSKI